MHLARHRSLHPILSALRQQLSFCAEALPLSAAGHPRSLLAQCVYACYGPADCMDQTAHADSVCCGDRSIFYEYLRRNTLVASLGLRVRSQGTDVTGSPGHQSQRFCSGRVWSRVVSVSDLVFDPVKRFNMRVYKSWRCFCRVTA